MLVKKKKLTTRSKLGSAYGRSVGVRHDTTE